MHIKYFKCTDPYSGEESKMLYEARPRKFTKIYKSVVNGEIVEDIKEDAPEREVLIPRLELDDMVEVTKDTYDAFVPSKESIEFKELRSYVESTFTKVLEKAAKAAILRAKIEAVKKAKEDKKPK